MLHAACCTLHVACCTLRVVRCMLHAAILAVQVRRAGRRASKYIESSACSLWLRPCRCVDLQVPQALCILRTCSPAGIPPNPHASSGGSVPRLPDGTLTVPIRWPCSTHSTLQYALAQSPCRSAAAAQFHPFPVNQSVATAECAWLFAQGGRV